MGNLANQWLGIALATFRRHMVASSSASPPRYHIAQSDEGWVLSIQNEHCSVMQVFSTASSARRAVDRMLEFFHVMSAQPPRAGRVA
jgi:hypothetical protein